MASTSASQALTLSRSISPPRPARSPLRPSSFVGSGSSSIVEVSTRGHGVHARKNSASSRSSSQAARASGLTAGAATTCQAESRTTVLHSSDASNFASKIEATFDQILVSDATIKLSFTPDTLRDSQTVFPSYDRSEVATPVHGNYAGFSQHLQPRPPRARDSLISDEINDDSAEGQAADSSNEYRAALFDIIHSLPPWERPQRDAKEEIVATVSPVTEESRVAPNFIESPAARSRLELPMDFPPVTLQKPRRRRRILAKDEKRDLAIERQVNNDLMDFFSAPPPSFRKAKADLSNASRTGTSAFDQLRKETLGRRSLSAIQRTSIAPLAPSAKKGYGVPPGLAEEIEQRENVASSATTAKVRFTTARAKPGPAPILAPVSILRRNSASTDATATTARNDREYESDAARAVRLAFAARFGDQASTASSAQHSCSGSTASVIFPSSGRRSVTSQQQGLLLPREAIGAALRLESDHPVAFPSSTLARGSSAEQSQDRGVKMQASSPLASPVAPDSAKLAPAAPHTEVAPTLAQLRIAMLNADTREQCINLLDRLLAGVEGTAEPLLV